MMNITTRDVAWPTKFFNKYYYSAHSAGALAAHGKHRPEQDTQSLPSTAAAATGPLAFLVLLDFPLFFS